MVQKQKAPLTGGQIAVICIFAVLAALALALGFYLG